MFVGCAVMVGRSVYAPLSRRKKERVKEACGGGTGNVPAGADYVCCVDCCSDGRHMEERKTCCLVHKDLLLVMKWAFCNGEVSHHT